MQPIFKTHYFKDGAFHPKNKWVKRIKCVLMAAFTVVSLGYVNETTVFAQRNSHDYKSPYIEFIQNVNPKLSYKDARDIFLSTLKWAQEFNIDPTLMLALAKVESGFVPHAISTSGAFGLMQIIPSWHKQKIMDAKKVTGTPELFNINTNIYLGTRVLKECMDNNNRNVYKALACYSGSTPGYDKKVLAEHSKIQKI